VETPLPFRVEGLALVAEPFEVVSRSRQRQDQGSMSPTISRTAKNSRFPGIGQWADDGSAGGFSPHRVDIIEQDPFRSAF